MKKLRIFDIVVVLVLLLFTGENVWVAVDMTVFGGEAVVADVYVAMASIVLSTIFSIYQFIMFVIRIAKKDFKGVAGRVLLLFSFVFFIVINFLLYLFILGFTGPNH